VDANFPPQDSSVGGVSGLPGVQADALVIIQPQAFVRLGFRFSIVSTSLLAATHPQYLLETSIPWARTAMPPGVVSRNHLYIVCLRQERLVNGAL